MNTCTDSFVCYVDSIFETTFLTVGPVEPTEEEEWQAEKAQTTL